MADPLSSRAFIGWRLEIFTAFFVPLQCAAVGLRFYARWLVVGNKFGIDDGLVAVTLIFQLVLSAIGVGE